MELKVTAKLHIERHPLDGATGIAHVDLKWSGYRERDSIDVLRGRSSQSQGKETSERQDQGRTRLMMGKYEFHTVRCQRN